MPRTTACAECPFRVGSPLRYDADAMDALESGFVPACHLESGMDAIFVGGDTCRGYEAWERGESGFSEPKE